MDENTKSDKKPDIKQYIRRLNKLAKGYDPELEHALADELLCDLLSDLGYSAVVDAYVKVKKWYG